MDDILQEMVLLGSRIKKKRDQEIALSTIKDIQELGKNISSVRIDDRYKTSIANLTKDIEKMRVEVEDKTKEMEKIKKVVLAEKDRNAQAVKDLQEKQTTSKKVYPRARYSVNMYRDVSRIRWQTDVDSSEVLGYTSGKSTVKTFKFDTSKQSQFFITNSLWDMEGQPPEGD